MCIHAVRTALEIVCGAGTHTEVNKHGRNVKETGDWKNKAQPLFFQVKEMVKKSSALKCWIPAEHKQSSIYVRLASASAADLTLSAIRHTAYKIAYSRFAYQLAISSRGFRLPAAGERAFDCASVLAPFGTQQLGK